MTVNDTSALADEIDAKKATAKKATAKKATAKKATAKKATAKKATAKKATAKKATAKKATAKKATAKKATAKKATAKNKPSQTSQAKFPRHSVEKALRIPKAIIDQNAGKASTASEAAKWTTGGSANGPFRVELSSAKKYGFLGTEGVKVVPSDRARRSCTPSQKQIELKDYVKLFLGRLISEVYAHYRGENLPDNKSSPMHSATPSIFHRTRLTNLLRSSMNRCARLNSSMCQVSVRLIDIGRTNQLGIRSAFRTKKVSVPAGATCFRYAAVRRPSRDAYDTIFKPAIEQTGLVPIRADDEIFATGKIMDQVSPRASARQLFWWRS